MRRREFLVTSTVGTAAIAIDRQATIAAQPAQDDPPASKQQASQKLPAVRFHAGHQHHSTDDDLRMLAALGVNHICADLPSRAFDDKWSVASLVELRKRVESFGIDLAMLPLPLAWKGTTRRLNTRRPLS